MLQFYTPWKRQKTFGFLTFSGVQEWDIGVKTLNYAILNFLEIGQFLSFWLCNLKSTEVSPNFQINFESH